MGNWESRREDEEARREKGEDSEPGLTQRLADAK